MELGKLSDDFCIVCGKAVRKINGFWMHVDPDSDHPPKLAFDGFYIIDTERSSNWGSVCFWKPNSSGYTDHINEAGVYSRNFCTSRPFSPETRFVPVDKVSSEHLVLQMRRDAMTELSVTAEGLLEREVANG